MRKRIFFLLAVFMVNMTMMAGCWNYREISSLSIVAGMAIDKDGQGKYKITIEIVDMHEGGREPKIKSKRLESYGDTILDAVRNAIKLNSYRLYWGHAEVVILSQEVAKEGIVQIIDILDRDAEPRLSIDLLVSKEKTAGELLSAQSVTTEIRSYEMNQMLDSQKSVSKAPKIQVYEFINALSGEGISPILPAVHLVITEGEETSELSGTAVFKRDKLVGFISEDETKSLLFITDKIKGGLLVLKENSESNHATITLEIFKNKTKVKPVYSNGKVSMDIEITTKVALDEHGANKNLTDEKGSLLLKRDAEELLKTNIKKVIQKLQKDFDADIFGFGKTIREDMPSLWKKIGPDWNHIFKNIDVNVDVNIEIKNTELLSKPIKVGD